MKFLRLLIATIAIFAGSYIQANPFDYDIVYVRYPLGDQSDPENPTFINISQGERPYPIVAGADLMLLHADGTETVLVDCDMNCSVYDTAISFDGQTVYYSYYDQFDIFSDTSATRSLIYKINLTPPYTPIQLTFDDGFDSLLYAGNTTASHDQGSVRAVRDMGATPLADGRILFTSNRAGLTSFDAGTDEIISGSVQELWVMDDHDGSANTRELSNMRKFDVAGMQAIQHPLQLKDGRILFSTWQDAGTRFRYANTSLFTLNPDGTNLQQWTEPHQQNKIVDHFITQLPNEEVVWGMYYPNNNYGFGILAKAPHYLDGQPDWMREPSNDTELGARQFERKGTVNLTPHTNVSDNPAPNASGKYSYPSVAPNGNLLVAYSTGYVNHFGARCNPDKCQALASGIYAIPNAMNNRVKNPNQLIQVKDDPNYNEIWARAVVPYQEIYGIPTPNQIPEDRNNTMGATALMGTSSMYARESAPKLPERYKPASRDTNRGNWMIQGADAGIYDDSEIWGVRIVAIEPKPFTIPLIGNPHDDLLQDSRITRVVSRYGSVHGERWKILGEFPLPHTASTDAQGNPDTSWKAEVPADTPVLIQTIDNRAMTLNSELTWRGLKAGEARLDCGGCHIHTGETLSYATTQSGQNAPIQNITGILNTEPLIQNSVWKLTENRIPLVVDTGTINFVSKRNENVEFLRDVEPIIQANCSTCHNGTQTPDFSMTGKALYNQLANGQTNETKAGFLQKGLYVRAQQSRASLLTWIMYNGRLDGRDSTYWDDDIDYPTNHPTMSMSMADKLTVTRWIDLGNPIDFPNSNTGFEYTSDAKLPVVTKVNPITTTFNNHFHVGFHDMQSGLNWSTLTVQYYTVPSGTPVTVTIDQATLIDDFDVLHIPYSDINLIAGTEYVLKVGIQDNAGNQNYYTERLIKE